MGEIPSGSSTKLNPRSTAVAPAVAFVRVISLVLRSRGFAQWMKPDQSAAPEASSSLGEAPRSSTPIPTSAAGASSSTHTPRSGAYLEPDWPAFFGGRKFLNGSRQADPQQVRTFYKEASRIFNDNAGNFDAHLTNNAAASSAFLRLLRSESVSNRALVDQIAGPCPLPNGAVASDHSRKAMA